MSKHDITVIRRMPPQFLDDEDRARIQAADAEEARNAEHNARMAQVQQRESVALAEDAAAGGPAKRLAEAQAAFDAAVQFHASAAEEARKTHGDHQAAVARRDELLAQVAGGSDVGVEELLAAEDDARHQLARRDIVAAKADQARARKDAAHLVVLGAVRDALEQAFSEEVDTHIGLAAEIDDLFTDLCHRLSDYRRQSAAVQVAYDAMRHHNTHTLADGHVHSQLLASLPENKKPRCRLPGGGTGTLVKIEPRAELFHNVLPGTIHGKREPISSLSGRLRQAFQRPLPKRPAVAA